MSKSLVGNVKNKKFTFLWLLIGGSMGNILLMLYAPYLWPIFLPSAVLSVSIAISKFDNVKRPKIWLAVDLILTIALIIAVLFYGRFPIEFGTLLPDALIIFGCILGIMNW